MYVSLCPSACVDPPQNRLSFITTQSPFSVIWGAFLLVSQGTQRGSPKANPRPPPSVTPSLSSRPPSPALAHCSFCGIQPKTTGPFQRLLFLHTNQRGIQKNSLSDFFSVSILRLTAELSLNAQKWLWIWNRTQSLSSFYSQTALAEARWQTEEPVDPCLLERSAPRTEKSHCDHYASPLSPVDWELN